MAVALADLVGSGNIFGPEGVSNAPIFFIQRAEAIRQSCVQNRTQGKCLVERRESGGGKSFCVASSKTTLSKVAICHFVHVVVLHI